jgi:hypothetical protein
MLDTVSRGQRQRRAPGGDWSATVALLVAVAVIFSPACTVLPWAQADPPVAAGGGAERLTLLIELLVVAEEPPRSGYQRDLFDHWSDTNGSGCTARQDALGAQAIGLVQRDIVRPCVIIEGDWYSLFDGVTHSGSPSEVDVDHVVALAEAWDSGAEDWSIAKRRQFANDPLNLLVVTRRSNQNKADLDAGSWMPERGDAWCITAAMMVLTKLRYAMTIDAAEQRGLIRMARRCDRSDQRSTGGFPLPGTTAFDDLAQAVLSDRMP